MTHKNKYLSFDLRDKRWIALLLTPSWISLLVGICCATGLLICVIVAANYQGTRYQQEVSEIREKQVNAEFSSEDAEFEGLEGNTLVDVLPLTFMWAIIGVVVYFFAFGIVQSLQRAVEFKSELGYMNASRNEMLQVVFVQLGIRIVAGGIWILYLLFFFGQIVPYAVDAALAASAVGLSAEAVLYSAICVVVVWVAMHLHTILIRLLILKPRIFTRALYIS